MSLSKEQRDALSADDFACPDKRLLPIHDARHVSMAWASVMTASGLSVDERDAARLRIVAKANSLGVNTSSWQIRNIQIEAMSLDLPAVEDHPNRMPFRGVLTRVDQPSDSAPGGSGGRLINVQGRAAERALASLLGMGVNYTTAFDGHDVQAKVGVITAATLEGNAIVIEGFIYAADFPEVAASIKAQKDQLGFSFEAQQIYVADPRADVLDITALTFTGAAILLKDKAAYRSTSIAANADEEIMNEELKALLAALASQLSDVATKVTALEASTAAAAAAAAKPATIAAEHATRLEAQAAELETAGLAAAAATLRANAAALRAGTPMAPVAAAAAPAAATVDLKPITDAIAALSTKVADITASAARTAEAPERKTLAPAITALLARAAVEVPTDGSKMNSGVLSDTLVKAGIAPEQRLQIKAALNQSGLLV